MAEPHTVCKRCQGKGALLYYGDGTEQPLPDILRPIAHSTVGVCPACRGTGRSGEAGAMTVMCLCRQYCTDAPERDGLREMCRGLPDPPREPLVEVGLVHRRETAYGRRKAAERRGAGQRGGER